MDGDKVGWVIQFLGGRKFLLALGAASTCSVLVWYGKITPEIFRDVVLGCVGSYIIGNVYQATKGMKETT